VAEAKKDKRGKEARKAKKIEERHELPEFFPGDTVKVFSKFKEGDKERVQAFQGTVIQIKGRNESKTFTARKVTRGIGVERIFPLLSPMIVKIEVKKHGKVRRAKLYYLRGKKGKETRVKQEAQEAREKPAGPETVAAK
jgi:large subunit ribosomal protein L19